MSTEPGRSSARVEPIIRSTPSRLGMLLSRPPFWIAVVCVLALVPIAQAFSRDLPDPPAKLLTLPAFELTSERGVLFGSQQLRGKVWVASFVFTSCPSVCPRLMERMQEVQHRTRNAGDAVHLVTFTVDPENDTPEKLAEYARRFHAGQRWSFLTGDYKVIEDTVVKGFKLAMGKDADNLFQIFHAERFALVDGEGTIRGYYEASDEGIDKLAKDISLVLNVK